MTTPASTWLPVPAAARRLELSERRVWQLVNEQSLGSALIAGRRLIDPADVASRKKRKKSTEIEAGFQWQLQSESLYDRIDRLEKQMAILLKEATHGR